MKNIYKFLSLATILTSFSACIDDPYEEYSVEKPQSISEYEYLKEYDVLKNYLPNDNFKLASGVSATDFVNGGTCYVLAKTNFNEVVAGNEMKYGSCVADNGTMNFVTVSDFVNLAKEANLSVFGHTLCWHAQQGQYPKTSVLGHITERKLVDRDVTDADNTNPVCTWNGGQGEFTSTAEGLHVVSHKTANFWDVQFWNSVGAKDLNPDFTYTIKVTIDSKSYQNKMNFKLGDWGGGIETQLDVILGTKTYEFQGSPASKIGNADLMLQSGFDEGEYIVKEIKVTHHENFWEGGTKVVENPYKKELITNVDSEGENTNFFANDKVSGISTGKADVFNDPTQGKCFVVHNKDVATWSWDAQFFINVDHKFTTGEKATLKMKIKADTEMDADGCQAHVGPGNYKHWAFFDSPHFTTEWKDYSSTITITADQNEVTCVAFNLSKGAPNVDDNTTGPVTPNNYYFDDIQIIVEGVTKETVEDRIPQTEKELYDTTYRALEKFISGIMTASNGYVKAWDVVNEPLSGEDKDGDGKYDLQSSKNVSEDDAKANFYWSDYLGDTYVRDAVALARKYGSATGADNLQLFVNDYNLESTWDNNQKLKDLIKWIEYWESDGVTKIDGIGSQMHISYYSDPESQKSQEDHIVEMLNLMAASGKLCRISELDMGYVDGKQFAGQTIKTTEMTLEMHKQMAEFYKFIVKKYLEIIPASQQYGICQWCPTDSPANSGWRAGEPTGLWNEQYNRKPQYAGFAEGLQNK
ncbi:MAG: endo-1,4-beta-xylanase [Bacteroidales bacterium]|nr:endo-1,4-beta-xylanase [Bacteroidales bacterium]